jgi:hypothetical protein
MNLQQTDKVTRIYSHDYYYIFRQVETNEMHFHVLLVGIQISPSTIFGLVVLVGTRPSEAHTHLNVYKAISHNERDFVNLKIDFAKIRYYYLLIVRFET